MQEKRVWMCEFFSWKRGLQKSFSAVVFLEKIFEKKKDLMWGAGVLDLCIEVHQWAMNYLLVRSNSARFLDLELEGLLQIFVFLKMVFGSWILEAIFLRFFHQWVGMVRFLFILLICRRWVVEWNVWFDLRYQRVSCFDFLKKISASCVHLKRPQVRGNCCKISEI